jgi:hypothetical protein
MSQAQFARQRARSLAEEKAFDGSQFPVALGWSAWFSRPRDAGLHFHRRGRRHALGGDRSMWFCLLAAPIRRSNFRKTSQWLAGSRPWRCSAPARDPWTTGVLLEVYLAGALQCGL